MEIKSSLQSIVTRKTQGEQEQHAIRAFSAVHNSFVFSDHLCDTLYVGTYSILKFFQVDSTGMLRITSSARYFRDGVGSSRPS